MKTSISFGLITIPVRVYPVIDSTADVSFKQISPKGNPIKLQRLDSETNEVVEFKAIGKAYELGGQLIPLAEEEVKALSPEAAAIAVLGTPSIPVNQLQVDEKKYLLTPEGKTHKAYVGLRDALRESNKPLVALIQIRTRQRLVLLIPYKNGILAMGVLYGHQIKDIDSLFNDIQEVELTESERKTLRQFIDNLAVVDVSQIKDETKERLDRLIEQKVTKGLIATEEKPQAAETADIFGQMRAQLEKPIEAKKKRE